MANETNNETSHMVSFDDSIMHNSPSKDGLLYIMQLIHIYSDIG